MARRGFLSRIADSLGNFGKNLLDFFGIGEEEPEEPRRPPPPPPGPPPLPPGPPQFNDEFRIWRDTTVGRDRYDADNMQQWLNLYANAVEPLEMDRDDFLQFWHEFLQAYYLTSGERGSLSRQQFHRNIGIRARDWEMDWQEWREVKRGTP